MTSIRAQRHRLAVAALLTLAAFLNFWELDQNGYANTYYSAGVRSMLGSWHDFVFVSSDPGGLVSIDKPPLALWLMTLSAKVFGYSGFPILLPEALAGIAAVGLLYLLVARFFGRTAGLVAGLALAVSPVSVAVNRDNTPDSLLALLLVAAVYCCVRAVEGPSLGWLVGTAALVGLAFETKMLLALVVVPGCGLAYLVLARLPWRTRAWHLLAAGAVAVVVAGAWIAAVDLTSPQDRPYVGSTTDNSALGLAFDYNGLGRVTGQLAGTPFAGLGTMLSGTPGPLRLIDPELGEQGAWLLPLAIAGLLVGLELALRARDRRRLAALIPLGGWFAATAIVFSFGSGVIHSYYLSTLAPATAGLVGAGAAVLATRGRWALAAAAGILATASLEVFLVRRSGYLGWLELLIAIGACVAAVGVLVPWRARGCAVLAAALVLLVAPAAWAETTLEWPGNGIFPGAGPSYVPGLAHGAGFAPPNGYPPAAGAPGLPNPAGAALAYAKGHGGTQRFELIAASELAVTDLVIQGERVAALGGFTGEERVLTPALLTRLVRRGEARYFLLGGNFPGTVYAGAAPIYASCRMVPDEAWSGFAGTFGEQLYDCS